MFREVRISNKVVWLSNEGFTKGTFCVIILDTRVCKKENKELIHLADIIKFKLNPKKGDTYVTRTRIKTKGN